MNKKRILNIHDDEDILDVLNLVLSEYYYVDGKKTIEEGLKFIKESVPDMVIIKHRLPEFDAVSTIEKIRELNFGTKSIILAYRDAENEIVKYIDSNANDFVILPFAPAILLAKIRKHLSETKPEISDKKAELQNDKMMEKFETFFNDHKAIKRDISRILDLSMKKPKEKKLKIGTDIERYTVKELINFAKNLSLGSWLLILSIIGFLFFMGSKFGGVSKFRSHKK